MEMALILENETNGHGKEFRVSKAVLRASFLAGQRDKEVFTIFTSRPSPFPTTARFRVAVIASM